ncbi:MAG: glycosyltransferase family 4 protein [Pelagibacterales bacterium]|nr:glycosyltransferase family 4 protein [Pelagibacterales bacterium]
MKVVCYFKEPANYTLSLKKKVYDSLLIDGRFLESNSLASNNEVEAFSNDSITNRFKKLWRDSSYYEVAIFNGFYQKELFFLLLFSWLQSKPLKIALDSDTPLNIPENLFKRILKKILLNRLFGNKRIYGLAGGNGSHKELFRYYGMEDNRIGLLPMVINVDEFRGAIRKREKQFEFLYVGRIEPHKNIRHLLETFKKTFSDVDDASLKIVGDGSELSTLEKEFSNSKIKFTAKLFENDLKQAYKNASIFVLPSLFEPWGLVVNEAMAEGLPVISSKYVGANHDLLEGKETGLIFDPEINGDLEAQMKRIYTDDSYYHAASKNAFNLLQNHWNYTLYRKQLLLAIDKMKND